MTENVTRFPGITNVHEPADTMLEKAKDWNCEDVVVCGVREDGQFIWGGNTSDAERISWLLTVGHKALMDNVRIDDDD